MAKSKKFIERSVIDVQSEGYSQYMADPEQAREDFTAGAVWIADLCSIEIVDDK